MAVSLLGYFFYIGTAFTAIMALLISLFNGPDALERARYYPRPVIARTVTASNEAHRRLLKKEANWQVSSAFGTKETSSTNSVEQSQVLFTAKADVDKSKGERHSYPHKPKKLLASRRDDLLGGRYATVPVNPHSLSAGTGRSPASAAHRTLSIFIINHRLSVSERRPIVVSASRILGLSDV